MKMLMNNSEYFDVLESVKARIRAAQYRAILGVNLEQILLYRSVIIANSQWGNKSIDNLVKDIKADFPDTIGYSVRNLKYMKFAAMFDDNEILQAALAQLTWYHMQALMDKVSDKCAAKTVENGWSRDILALQIKSNLYERQAIADSKR